MALVTTLQDNFNDGVVNATLWNRISPSSNEVETLGRAKFTTVTGSANYSGLTSVSTYDHTGCRTFVEVYRAGLQSLATGQTYLKILKDASNSVTIYISNGAIYYQKQVAGSFTSVSSTTYNPTTMRWLAIRESGGQTYWEYSQDGVTWTSIHNEANPQVMTSIKVEIAIGTYASEATATTGEFDNLNIAPPTTYASTQYNVGGSSSDANQVISSGANVITNQGSETGAKLDGTNHAGFRWSGITIERDRILRAVVKFPQLFNWSGGTARMNQYTLYGHKSSNSPVFSTTASDISGRTRTSEFIEGYSLMASDTQFTTSGVDVTNLLKEVMGMEGWFQGNAFSLLFIGSGTAGSFIQPYMYDYTSGLYAAQLFIYTKSGEVHNYYIDQDQPKWDVSFQNAVYESGYAGGAMTRRGQYFKPGTGRTKLAAIKIKVAAYSGDSPNVMKMQLKVWNNYTDADNNVEALGVSTPITTFSGTSPTDQTFVFPVPIDVVPGNTYFFALFSYSNTALTYIYYYDNDSTYDYTRGNRISASYGGAGGTTAFFSDTGDLYFSTYYVDDNILVRSSTSKLQNGNAIDAGAILSTSPSNVTFYNGQFQQGQVFTGDGNTIGSIDVWMKKNGTASGNINMKIYAATGTYGTNAKGTGVALAVSDTVSITNISTTGSIVRFSFSGANQIALTNGSKYAFYVDPSGSSTNSTNSLVIGFSTNNLAGNWTYYDGTTFYGDNSADIWFQALRPAAAPGSDWSASGINYGYATLMDNQNVVSTINASGNIIDDTIQLINNGTLLGSNKARSSSFSWPNSVDHVLYGSSTDTWGATLTGSILSNAFFGVAIRVKDSAAPTTIKSEYLWAMGFGFNIPAGVTPLGVEVELVCSQAAPKVGNYAYIDTVRMTVYLPNGVTMTADSLLSATGFMVAKGSANLSSDALLTAAGNILYKGSATIGGDSKLIADRIRFVGGSILSASGSVNPLTITKSYIYKIYDKNMNYLGIWTDVVSDFGYSQEINSAGSSIDVTLARNSDSLVAAIDTLADDTGTDFNTDDNNTIAAEKTTANSIGPGTTVDLNLNVRIYEFNSNAFQVDGTLVFSGYISKYTSQYGSTENTVVSVFSYGADLDNWVLADSSGNTRLTYYSQDPSVILKDTLDKFATNGGIITYDATTVDLTSTIATYTFNLNTELEVIKKCLELAPTDWYFYADLANNKLHFHGRPTTPSHYFYLGKHVLGLNLEKTMEGLINDVYFTGGKPTYLSQDTFSDVSGTALVSHTGEVGATWTKHPSSATGTGFVITDQNRIRQSATGEQLVMTTTDAGTNNYTIKVDYWVPASGPASGDIGVAARVNPSALTYYLARIWNDSTVQLYKCVAGTYTLLQSGTLSTALAPGQTRHFEFTVDGNQLTIRVDGTTYVDIVDASITLGSRYGVRGGTGLANNTTGLHLDNFTVALLDTSTQTNLFKRYTNSTSITTYRRGLDRKSDNRVSLTSSADIIAASEINRYKDPRYRSSVTISNMVYDTSLIKLGQLVGFRNFGNFVDTVTMQIVRIDYTPDSVTLQLDTLLPSVPKRLEDIRRNLNQSDVEDNPSAPA